MSAETPLVLHREHRLYRAEPFARTGLELIPKNRKGEIERTDIRASYFSGACNSVCISGNEASSPWAIAYAIKLCSSLGVMVCPPIHFSFIMNLGRSQTAEGRS